MVTIIRDGYGRVGFALSPNFMSENSQNKKLLKYVGVVLAPQLFKFLK